jgi:glycosyltransferase-like protein
MTAVHPLRVGILAHSTNPRGGVVHALALGDALTLLGHEAVVHAPDVTGAGFFRGPLCATVSIPASPVSRNIADMVDIRVGDYVRYFAQESHRRFDVFHAQDGISGTALATLREQGLIRRFARTVHHVDAFADPRLDALQTRSILTADELFVVSRMWRDQLRDRFGKSATIVGNGVDRTLFSPTPDGREDALRRRFNLTAGPGFLAIGGVEERKNTIAILRGFAEVWRTYGEARLVIAGGASVLDHGDYRRRFAAALAASGLPAGTVIVAGSMPQADMPALYRVADTLVFPSLNEGFGLVVVEAMACGRPVVAAKIAPFTDYLGEGDAVWCNPHDIQSIAAAMTASLAKPLRDRLAMRGLEVAARHEWRRVAEAHLAAYAALREFEHA